MSLHGRLGPEFDHIVLRVAFDRDYVVDVGNGQSCREPLPVEGGTTSTSEGIDYRIARHGDGYAMYYRRHDEDWRPRFLFSTRVRRRSEFADMCRYHQTSPESSFTRKPLVTLATAAGRMTLAGTRLSVAVGEALSEFDLASATDLEECLAQRFGIALPAGSGVVLTRAGEAPCA